MQAKITTARFYADHILLRARVCAMPLWKVLSSVTALPLEAFCKPLRQLLALNHSQHSA
jgi:hypothetical protein